MKIALIGYGKMGHAIEAVAVSKGHECVCKVGIENLEDLTIANLRKADVAIEFTGPDSAFQNLKLCFDAGVPVVCGSTGWLDRYNEATSYCESKHGRLLYASNFSIGVNIFFALNTALASLLRDQPAYDVQITEIHHTQKLDAPSGTAITLAEQVLQHLGRKNTWVKKETADGTQDRGQLLIVSERVDPAPGTHIVNYHSDIDDITITHTAHSRQGFASGAVQAAEFLLTRKAGVYSMQDVLGIGVQQSC